MEKKFLTCQLLFAIEIVLRSKVISMLCALSAVIEIGVCSNFVSRYLNTFD